MLAKCEIALQQRFWLSTLDSQLLTFLVPPTTEHESRITSHDSRPHLCTRIAFGGETRANALFGRPRGHGLESAGQFLLNECGERFHLMLHFGHLFAHVEDDFDAGQVDAHLACQGQDDSKRSRSESV